MNQRIPNPDCRDGKHTICDGHGWDIDADTAVRCPCSCHTLTGGAYLGTGSSDRLGIAPPNDHRPCTCGARKTREHCTCKHRLEGKRP